MSRLWIAGLAIAVILASLCAPTATAQRRMRKYKAPPQMAEVEVTVLKGATDKPLFNAAVVFHPLKNEKDDGNMEMKTNEQGKANLRVVPLGSKVLIQVIVPGYRTFGQEYEVPTDKKAITIRMLPPTESYSVYGKNSGKDGQTNTPQTQMGHATPSDSPLLAPAQKKKKHSD